jgi:hypothetical protein
MGFFVGKEVYFTGGALCRLPIENELPQGTPFGISPFPIFQAKALQKYFVVVV